MSAYTNMNVYIHAYMQVLVGLDSPDDCAVVAPDPQGRATVHTVGTHSQKCAFQCLNAG